MNTQFRESFSKDLRKIRDKDLLNRVKAVIEAVEQAQGLGEIPNLERLKDWNKYYRIRVGDYRLGLVIEGDIVTFVRFLHRKDLYRYFP
ncbi:MAG: type II toxin-antitoxin system mRNA interferase toxin, RelE/StbE family [Chloroflexi bacterium]|nr:type II toxin-antitoxin system mRNA interferase toxin, RelE/StbE family [Chloroflexota bacterium]